LVKDTAFSCFVEFLDIDAEKVGKRENLLPTLKGYFAGDTRILRVTDFEGAERFKCD